jgi:glycosyltransferase involved in cell wall biosynthesis
VTSPDRPPFTVSVVVPLYQKERHVERALRSALGQSRPPEEILVIDDGSTDGGAAVVERIAVERATAERASAERATAEGGRLRLFRQKNGGISRARNAGIAAARYGHIAFLDADDEWDPGYLEEIEALARLYPEAGLYCTGYRIVQPDGSEASPRLVHVARAARSLIPNYFKAAIHGSPVWTSATVVPKRVLDEVGGFAEVAGRGEDLELWSRIALRHRIAFSRLQFAIYHKDSDNRSDVKRAVPEAGAMPTRWWVLERMAVWISDSSLDRGTRRWIREWARWCDIVSAAARWRSGLRPSGLGAAFSACIGSYAFFYGLAWFVIKGLRRRPG